MVALPLFSGLSQACSETVAMLRRDDRARRLVWALFGVNLIVILLPVVAQVLEVAGLIPDTPRPLIHPGTDGSLPEVLNYAQAGGCALFLALTGRRCASPVLYAWAGIFAFILIDDAFQYHERFGAGLAQALSLPAMGGLRAVDFGELLAWALAGLILLPLALRAAFRAQGIERGMGLMILLVFVALVFFAVVIDMAHSALGSRIVLLLEDGGEMLCIATACALSFTWWRNYHPG